MQQVIMTNICTVFGLGNFTKMPGTLGSIAGVFLGLVLLYLLPIQLVIVFFIFLLAASLYAIKTYQKVVGKSDKSEIIIDEVLGQLLVIMFIDIKFLEILFAFILFTYSNSYSFFHISSSCFIICYQNLPKSSR